MTAPISQPVREPGPGSYPLESPLLTGWTNIKVWLPNDKKRYEIIRLGDGARYRQEPTRTIAFKCALLVIGLPFYFACYTAFHLLRTPIVTLVNRSLTALVDQIWTLVRIPFYLVAMEFAALYGVIEPLEGRAKFGQLEKELHDEKPRRADVIRFDQLVPTHQQVWNAFAAEKDPSAFFIGFCMQSYGDLRDPYIQRYEILQSSPTA